MVNLQENIMSTKKETIELTINDARRIQNILAAIMSSNLVRKSFVNQSITLFEKINKSIRRSMLKNGTV